MKFIKIFLEYKSSTNRGKGGGRGRERKRERREKKSVAKIAESTNLEACANNSTVEFVKCNAGDFTLEKEPEERPGNVDSILKDITETNLRQTRNGVSNESNLFSHYSSLGSNKKCKKKMGKSVPHELNDFV